MEYAGASQTAAFEAIKEKVRATTLEVLETAKARNMPLRESAVALAAERVKKAMALRRWSLF